MPDMLTKTSCGQNTDPQSMDYQYAGAMSSSDPYMHILLCVHLQLKFWKNLYIMYRVRTGPGNPGKSWNFVVTFSRTGKSWKNTAGPGKSWKSVKLNKVITFFLKQMSKIFECYYNVCIFGVLEKTI